MTSRAGSSSEDRGRLRRVMVTGANGFVGRHVLAELTARGIAGVAVGRDGEIPPDVPADTYVTCDLTDAEQVERLPLADVDALINLAGLAAVGPSFSEPDRYRSVNVGVLETLCTVAAARQLSGLRIIAVSSGAVYAANQAMPLTESSAVDPTSSPYAASKIAMEECARRHRDRGVDCVVVRPFNHIGPGQGPGFLIPDLFAQIEQARTSGGPLLVGNLETRRDYTDVRDVAAAYLDLAAATELPHDLYNVCRGQAWAGTEILAGLLRAAGIAALEVQPDPARFRPSDQPHIVGDHTRLSAAVAWQPTRPLDRSLHDFVSARRAAPG